MSQKKRQRGAFSLMLYWTRILLLGMFCRCPKCAKGNMFKGLFEAHKICPHCGVTLQPYEGDTAGVIGLGYCVFLPPSALIAFLAGYYLKCGPLWVIVTFTLSTTLLLLCFFRNMKSTWIAIVYLMTGFRKNL